MSKVCKISLIIIILLALFSSNLLLTGCSKKDIKPPTELPEEITESLADLINKSKEITSIKYDIITSIPDQPTITQKIWVKGMRQRIEFEAEGEIIVYLIDYDKQISYNYTPQTNTALKVEMGDISEAVDKSLLDMTKSIDINSKIIGSEVIDGKECTVIEHGAVGMGSVKMWVWKARGIPIKMESRSPDGVLTIVEYKNIDFSPIPDYVFELPENVHIYQY